MDKKFEGTLERIDQYRWRIPRSHHRDMRVDGVIYADDRLMDTIRTDYSLQQVANVACLPGIVHHSLAMPDIHFGYGFCIGGVAATDPAQGGVISPGGVGYDINCGVRLIRTNLTEDDVKPRLKVLIDKLFATIPCGVGQRGKISFDRKELKKLMREGSRFVVDRGFGFAADVEVTEAGGCIEGADPDLVSDRALERGKDQCGTLGSGNHFLEVQVVQAVFGEKAVVNQGVSTRYIYRELLKQIVRMFQTGQPPIAPEESVEIVAFIEAALESGDGGGRPVQLNI